MIMVQVIIYSKKKSDDNDTKGQGKNVDMSLILVVVVNDIRCNSHLIAIVYYMQTTVLFHSYTILLLKKKR